MTNVYYDDQMGWWTSVVMRADQIILQWRSIYGRSYRVYSADQLVGFEWSAEYGPVDGTGDPMSYTNELDSFRRFYRIGVEMGVDP